MVSPRGDALDAALTKTAGDAGRGREVFLARERGHCIMCHRLPGVDQAGDFGPDLQAVGARYTSAQLRQRVVDITAVNAEAAMPAFYRGEGLKRVDPRFATTLLSAQDVEDVVAFLVTLR
jgi:L-cysteine S-thiosulfotransferase